MADKPAQYVYYIIIFTLLIDLGDGKWKKKEREDFHHDVLIFKKMAEKIQSEMRDFYGKYTDDIFRKNDEQKDNVQEKISSDRKRHHSANLKYKYLYPFTNNVTTNSKDTTKYTTKTHLSVNIKPTHVPFGSNVNNLSSNDTENSNSIWPKFEEILRAIGKKYDWKNDRWIKVRERLKESRKKLAVSVQSENFHLKHNFSYRTVKLNTSKSRRNIVIAVSAVR